MLVMPTIGMAETFSIERLAPMIRDNQRLVKLFPENGFRANNKRLVKKYPGGTLVLSGAESPASLSSRPVRWAIIDELDRCPLVAGGEGDVVSLVTARTKNFYNRKIALFSTPTNKAGSVIHREFLASDQRFYMVGCPHCGHRQRLVWKNLKWETEGEGDDKTALPETAIYACEKNGCVIEERHKREMLAGGEWVATAESKVRGYHISELYSPFRKWSELVQEFVEKKDNPEQLKTFVNLVLGEVFEDRRDAPPWKEIQQKYAGKYKRGIVPEKNSILFAGGDAQKDRIEVEIVAYGPRLRSWSVDLKVIYCDPSLPESWVAVQALLDADYPVEGGGTKKIAIMAVDTGYETHAVYAFGRNNPTRVMCVKGQAGPFPRIASPTYQDINFMGRKIANGARLFRIGVDSYKSEVYSWLRVEPGAPCSMSFPEGYDDEYYQQLTAEEVKITRKRTGHVRAEWVKARERNEALDCRVYARAASMLYGIDHMSDEHWQQIQNEHVTKKPAPAQPKKRGSTGIKL
jgi:phage terminase large subunit GpA-like protein